MLEHQQICHARVPDLPHVLNPRHVGGLRTQRPKEVCPGVPIGTPHVYTARPEEKGVLSVLKALEVIWITHVTFVVRGEVNFQSFARLAEAVEDSRHWSVRIKLVSHVYILAVEGIEESFSLERARLSVDVNI